MITIQEAEHRFVVCQDTHEIGEMVWSQPDEHTLIIEHTFLAEAARGQNIGEQLMEHMIAKAHKEAKKIIPVCPFAIHQFELHPDYQTVLKTT